MYINQKHNFIKNKKIVLMYITVLLRIFNYSKHKTMSYESILDIYEPPTFYS